MATITKVRKAHKMTDKAQNVIDELEVQLCALYEEKIVTKEIADGHIEPMRESIREARRALQDIRVALVAFNAKVVTPAQCADPIYIYLPETA
jgi:hypothetical protein